MDLRKRLFNPSVQAIDPQTRFWYIENQPKVHCDLIKTDFPLLMSPDYMRESVFFLQPKSKGTKSKQK